MVNGASLTRSFAGSFATSIRGFAHLRPDRPFLAFPDAPLRREKGGENWAGTYR